MKIERKIHLFQLTNKIASVIIYVICIIILSFPYMPAIQFFVEQHITFFSVAVPDAGATASLSNELIIPSINVNEEIVEASSIGPVHEKVWHRPGTSTPDQGSNTVLVAHRYATIGGNRSSTFYNLPDLKEGDSISVVWDGKLYTYEVYETAVVEPTAIEIEAPTTDAILTLYTCTPLWTAAQRFVVKARLTNIQ